MHSDADTVADTDWLQILRLYDQLLVVWPNPMVALNRVVAVAEVDGPLLALATIDELSLTTSYMFHAIRADLLRRLGRIEEAVDAYHAAIDLSGNQAERDLFMQAPCGMSQAVMARRSCQRLSGDRCRCASWLETESRGRT